MRGIKPISCLILAHTDLLRLAWQSKEMLFILHRRRCQWRGAAVNRAPRQSPPPLLGTSSRRVTVECLLSWSLHPLRGPGLRPERELWQETAGRQTRNLKAHPAARGGGSGTRRHHDANLSRPSKLERDRDTGSPAACRSTQARLRVGRCGLRRRRAAARDAAAPRPGDRQSPGNLKISRPILLHYNAASAACCILASLASA